MEVQQAGDHTASSFWTSDKWVLSKGHRYLEICQAGCFGTYFHSSPLLSEYFASAIIYLEIKFISVSLNVNFLLHKTQHHIWIIIFKMSHSFILPHLLCPQSIQFVWRDSAKCVSPTIKTARPPTYLFLVVECPKMCVESGYFKINCYVVYALCGIQRKRRLSD